LAPKTEDLISPEYQALLQRQHSETKWGADTDYRHLSDVLRIATENRCASILDYGSGRESLRRDVDRISLKNLPVACYDPGTDRTDLPEPADLVVCGDVLEHVQPEKLDAVLEHIFSLANKAIFLVIALRQAKAPLVDGSPAHLVVEDSGWWIRKLQPLGRSGIWVVKKSSAVEGKELKVLLTKRVAA
jgi:hypothetical protein